MVNQRLVEYVRTNLDKGYSIEQLKQTLIQHGYNRAEVEEAASMAYPREIPPMQKSVPNTKEKPKDIKWLAVLYGIWLLMNSIIMLIPVLFFQDFSAINIFSYVFIPWIASIIILPLLIFGILKYAKWGLYLAFGFSIFHLVDGIIGINIIKIAVHGVILYYLYKWRTYFD